MKGKKKKKFLGYSANKNSIFYYLELSSLVEKILTSSGQFIRRNEKKKCKIAKPGLRTQKKMVYRPRKKLKINDIILFNVDLENLERKHKFGSTSPENVVYRPEKRLKIKCFMLFVADLNN